MTPARDEHRISAYCESLADEAEAATEERKAKTEASRLEFDALMDKLRAASQPPSLPVDAPAQPSTPSAPPSTPQHPAHTPQRPPLPPQQHGYLTPGPSSRAERALQDPSAHVRRQMSAPAAVRSGTGPGGSTWEDGGTRAPRAASPHASRSPGVHVEGVAAGAQGYGAPTPASLGLLPSPHTRSTAASSPVTHTRGDAVSSIVRLA